MKPLRIRKAERKKAKLRLGISAPSGAGKTYSSLLIAYGLTGDWEKIGMIDTENGSGDLYAHLGEYSILPLEAPYTPERYIEAIKEFENAGFEVIIIDSLSHAWAGEGGALDIQGAAAAKTGNSYTAWREVTPKHNALVNAMLQSKCHIIATMRSKTEYVIEKDDRGKAIPRKIGMAPIQRDGMEYEFTVMMDIAQNHTATTTKDRTGLLDGQYFTPGVETGKLLLEWLNTGAEMAKSETMSTIRSMWIELGYKEELLEQQIRKVYGCSISGLTEKNAQDFIKKLNELKAKQDGDNQPEDKILEQGEMNIA